MKQVCKTNSESGFSMMELMVVIVLTLVVVSAAFALLGGTIRSSSTNVEVTSAQQEFRNTQEMLTRDILRAGDGLSGISNLWLPSPFVTNYLTARPDSVIDPSAGGFVSIGATVSDNDVPSGTNVIGSNPTTTVMENTDRLTILSTDQSFATIDLPVNSTAYWSGRINIPAARIADFSVGEVYYISSGGTGVFGAVTSVDTGSNQIYWEEGDTLGLNRMGWTGNLAAATDRNTQPATLKRVNMIHFYVDANGRFMRRVFGVKDKPYTDSVVAEHLTDLQFRFVLKPAGSGTIFEQPIEQLDIDKAPLVRVIEASATVTTAPLSNGTVKTIEGSTKIGVRNVQFLEAPVPRDSEGNTELPDPEPTPVVTPTPTPTPPTPTPTPPTPTPSITPTPTPTPPTPTPTSTPPTPTPTSTPPTPTPTATPPTPTPTATPPTPTPTPPPTPTPDGDG